MTTGAFILTFKSTVFFGLSEESKDILLDIRLPSLVGVLGVDHFEFKIGTLKVSYFDVGSTSLKV